MVSRCCASIVAIVILTLQAAAAQPGPVAPPPPPPPPRHRPLPVPQHIEAVAEQLSLARAPDVDGGEALAEARASLAAARTALSANALRTADELAASADDLIHAADGPPHHGVGLDPAKILERMAGFASVLVAVPGARVHRLLTLADGVADEARRKAARGDADAGWEAARAEAIARAATHVAIAADPSFAPLPPPKPPRPPDQPS